MLLIQHCEREAKKMIEFCSLLEPSVGYIGAKAILKKNFGRKIVIARSSLEKLQQGPVLRPNDKQGIMQLARELEECNTTLFQLKYASYLNNLKIMTTAVINVYRISHRHDGFIVPLTLRKLAKTLPLKI